MWSWAAYKEQIKSPMPLEQFEGGLKSHFNLKTKYLAYLQIFLRKAFVMLNPFRKLVITLLKIWFSWHQILITNISFKWKYLSYSSNLFTESRNIKIMQFWLITSCFLIHLLKNKFIYNQMWS